MKSRGMGLDKEDNVAIDEAIQTADSQGDKFQCNNQIEDDKMSYELTKYQDKKIILSKTFQ